MLHFHDFLRRRLLLAPLLVLVLLSAGCAAAQHNAPTEQVATQPAAPQTTAAELVREAARTLREMRAASPEKSLDYWLEDARGIVILPGVYQAGFFYSLHAGEGVVLARRTDGGWSSPAFMSVAGAGYGVQAGLEKARLLLVVTENEAMEDILAGGPGVDFTTMYDGVGVREAVGPDSRTRGKPVIAVSDGAGIMAGVAAHAGSLHQSPQLNAAYYGTAKGGPALDAHAVFQADHIPGLEVLELWDALRISLPQAQRVRTQPAQP